MYVMKNDEWIEFAFTQHAIIKGKLYRLSLRIWLYSQSRTISGLAFDYRYFVEKYNQDSWKNMFLFLIKTKTYDFQENKEYLCMNCDYVNYEYHSECNEVAIKFCEPQYFIPIALIKSTWFKTIGL